MRGSVVHRITFSKALADLMLSKLDSSYRIERIQFCRGRPLVPDEKSSTGLYVLTTGCGHSLRVSLIHEAAHLLCDWKNNFLYECHLAAQYVSNGRALEVSTLGLPVRVRSGSQQESSQTQTEGYV